YWCYDRHRSVRLVVLVGLAIDQIAQSGLSSLSVIYYSAQLFSLIDLCMQLRMLSLHNERLSEIVFSEPEQELPAREVFSADSGAKLEVKNLCYQYDPFSQPIFSNLNITVEPGESVALIGPSGVGKTTLLKVMCGLLSPTSGDVLADNLDITKIGLNNYRHGTACVLQEDRLFSGSLIDNISGFEDNADINFVMECARRCNIHDEIMKMPMGYETIVGELGLGISGGQKQRILIARALYRKPSILFMDEATSHLDLKNESVINQSISALSITRIIVAHRPSTIASADRVIDLSQTKNLAPA
ncbi:ATP-binding cassette domain-containing protein, partial [Klebsiella pneumoniae]